MITDYPVDGNRVDLTLEMKLLEYITAMDSVPMETLLNEIVNGKAAAMPEDALQQVAESVIQKETSQTDEPSTTLDDRRRAIDTSKRAQNRCAVATLIG